MSSSVSAPARPRTAASVASWSARALLALVGAVGVWATIYFSFFASQAEGRVSGPVDWVVAVWSMVVALGYLSVAVRLGDGTRRTLRLAYGLVIAHIVFNLVKLVGYGETASFVFFALDAAIMGLLAAGRRSR